MKLNRRRMKSILLVLLVVVILAGFSYRPRLRAPDYQDVIFRMHMKLLPGMDELAAKTDDAGIVERAVRLVNEMGFVPLPYNRMLNPVEYSIFFTQGGRGDLIQFSYNEIQIRNRCYRLGKSDRDRLMDELIVLLLESWQASGFYMSSYDEFPGRRVTLRKLSPGEVEAEGFPGQIAGMDPVQQLEWLLDRQEEARRNGQD